MRVFFFALIVTCATIAIAQQPGSPQNPQQPGTPPSANPSRDMPPDQMTGMAGSSDNAQVEQDIQQAWQSQSELSKDKLNAQVSGGSVTVTGTVENESQHQKALHEAALHAEGMRLIDKIKVQPH